MDRILKIGMDVHSTNYTLCAVESRFGKEDHVLANIMELMKQIRPESSAVLIARYFEGKTYPEIGHEQFITERQAQRKEKTAIKAFQRVLDRNEPTEA